MDIKLKNNNGRTIAYGFSTMMFPLAATVAYVATMALVMSYEMSNATGKPVSALVNVEMIWWSLVGALVIALLTMVLSFVYVGKKNHEGEMKLNWFDRIFTDLQLAVGACAVAGIGGMAYIVQHVITQSSYYEFALGTLSEEECTQYMEWYGWWANADGFEPYSIEILFMIVALAALFGVLLLLCQSLIKKLKTGNFWKTTIIGKFGYYLLDAAQRSEGVFWKVIGILVGGALLSATWFGIILVFIGIFAFVPKMLRKYEAIKTGVNEVKRGNLDYNIPVEGKGELDRLAASINEISDATSVAVQNELKNQRLKTDLISNVSHDLKTPLTSMLSYVDLLKTEGLDSENAKAYLDIIDEKTKRLQQLTEDLFEAAKASSGAVPVNMGKIEMTSIVNQALGELETKLMENNLEVIFAQKTEQTYVMADGQLLWRVIENLLVNASKYALPGSRVYVDLIASNDEEVTLEVKNMSKDPLNIDADELMERFKRGDESRNTEGSGLGLAIAKDLVKLMNGQFMITVDGDLFKASVSLQRPEL